MVSREAEVAWAAGLFEGEGSAVVASAGDYMTAQLMLSMTDQDVVEKFARIIELGRVRPLNMSKRPAHHKPQWRWQVAARDDVRYVIELILPYMGTRRTERLLEVLAFLDSRDKMPHGTRAIQRESTPIETLRAAVNGL